MTTSGTYNSFLSEGDLVLESFDRCGIRPVEITRERMASCKRSFNLELQSWAVKGINLWAIDLYPIPLVASTASYTLPAYVLSLMDVYLSDGASDTYLSPMGRSDYAMLSDKAREARPTSYWFNRKATPEVKVWPVPESTGTYTLNAYIMRQIQDVNLLGSETVDVPYRFQDALCAGVAKRLALKHAPAKFTLLKEEANEAYALAGLDDRERVEINLMPNLSGYYR